MKDAEYKFILLKCREVELTFTSCMYFSTPISVTKLKKV